MRSIRILLAIATLASITAPLGCGGGGDRTPAELRLIAKADAICAESQKAMDRLSKEFPRGERSRGIFRKINYAEGLLDISEPAAERLAALKPPPSIRAEYEKYLESQQRVYYEDLTFVHAGHSFHLKEYFTTHRRLGEDEQEGYGLAGEIGLQECGSTPG
jgi:hypothetical protein